MESIAGRATSVQILRSPAETAESGRTPFIKGIRIDHGPAEALARFLIAVDAEFSAKGIDLFFATFAELLQANRANRDSWKPLNSTFVARNGIVDEDTAFALLGVDRSGVVVTAGAVKLFSWQTTSFKAEAESLRLLYADPSCMAPAGGACRVTSATAASIAGRVAYGGAVWLHPSVRKLQLAGVLSRMLRGVAYARWGYDLACGISSVGLIGKGYSERGGWTHIEPGIHFSGLDECPPEAGLVWTTAEETIADLTSFTLRAWKPPGSEGVGRPENAPLPRDVDGSDDAREANRRGAG
ncbi:MAG: hypothetical protein AB7O57_03255 [Hyphomicrobiaceae bacterium]